MQRPILEDRNVHPVSNRVIESQALVQRADGLQLTLVQVETSDLQVLRQTGGVVALRDDSNPALGGPAEQHLSRGLAILLGEARNGVVLEQRRGIDSILHFQLKEAQRSERRVRSDSDALLLGILDQTGLGKIGVVFNLEGSGTDARIPEEVHEQLGAEVANADAARELLVDQRLHRCPGLLDGSVAEFDLAALRVPSRWVADSRVNVLQGNGKVHDVQVEVFDAPVSQLLAADGLDAVALVETVPQLGNNEEILALDDALLDGAGDTLATFNFVAVVWTTVLDCPRNPSQ